MKLHRDCPRDCVSKFTLKKGQLTVPSCVAVLVSEQEVSRPLAGAISTVINQKVERKCHLACGHQEARVESDRGLCTQNSAL